MRVKESKQIEVLDIEIHKRLSALLGKVPERVERVRGVIEYRAKDGDSYLFRLILEKANDDETWLYLAVPNPEARERANPILRQLLDFIGNNGLPYKRKARLRI